MSHSRSIADLVLRLLHESESWQGDEPLQAAGTCLGSLGPCLINVVDSMGHRNTQLERSLY